MFLFAWYIYIDIVIVVSPPSNCYARVEHTVNCQSIKVVCNTQNASDWLSHVAYEIMQSVSSTCKNCRCYYSWIVYDVFNLIGLMFTDVLQLLSYMGVTIRKLCYFLRSFQACKRFLCSTGGVPEHCSLVMGFVPAQASIFASKIFGRVFRSSCPHAGLNLPWYILSLVLT